jgi:hypothetical protein
MLSPAAVLGVCAAAFQGRVRIASPASLRHLGLRALMSASALAHQPAPGPPHHTAHHPAQLVPVYETLPGWKADISKVRTWQDLPAAARAYVERCEQLLGVPIKWIGVGPGRDAIVVKPE